MKKLSNPKQSKVSLLKNDYEKIIEDLTISNRKLSSENFQLNNLIDNLPGDIYWKDKNGIWSGVNKRGSQSLQQIGFIKDRNDVIGKSDYELFSKETADEYRKNDLEVLSKKVEITKEESNILPNGEKIIQLSTKRPLWDKEGNVVGIVGNTIDITYLKKIETELKYAKEYAEAASHAKTEFIANMSHDIRTPLTGVIGMSEILESELENPEQKEEAHIIHDGGEELLSMLNDILDDIKAGNINEDNIHSETFDLYACIEDLVKLERPTTTAKELGLFIEIDPKAPVKIINDRKKIHRILLNLLGNAIKFTPSGHITIQVTCLKRDSDEAHLRFSVKDTGIGIPKDKQDKVFERFFRVTPSYKGLYKGHGLGLHIAQSYAQLLGGDIALTSEEGVGSTFHFDIPCKIATDDIATPTFNKKSIAEAPSPTLPPQVDELPSISPYFLLIEDNLMALKVLESIVTKAGCRYQSVMNGEEALELMKSTVFDLVITDIGLPGISGTELTSLIRTWEKENNRVLQPIVGLTGHARETALDECIAAGMNDVFTKPANLTLVQDLIKNYVSNNDAKQPIEDNQLPVSAPAGLGKDLPNTEDELFQLDKYPLFDPKIALEQVNDLALLFQILKDFLSEETQNDILLMKKAYENKDWSKVENLAHKLKGGAVYMGTCRMQYACQYLERYYKANHRTLLEQLYHQLVAVNDQTCKELNAWLKKYDIKVKRI